MSIRKYFYVLFNVLQNRLTKNLTNAYFMVNHSSLIKSHIHLFELSVHPFRTSSENVCSSNTERIYIIKK